MVAHNIVGLITGKKLVALVEVAKGENSIYFVRKLSKFLWKEG